MYGYWWSHCSSNIRSISWRGCVFMSTTGGLQLDNSIILEIANKYTNSTNGEIPVIFCWVPSRIGIKGNGKADAAAKRTLKSHYITKWQQHWDDQIFNKLHSVKPVLGYWLSGNLKRREELVWSRAHIGHTYLTHKYLLSGEDPLFCISFHQTLKVEHIFLHCVEFNNIRKKCFNVSTLNERFSYINLKVVFQFLREAGLHKLF